GRRRLRRRLLVATVGDEADARARIVLGAADLALERGVGERDVARDRGVVRLERLGVAPDLVQAARAPELRRPVAAGAHQDGVVLGERAIGVARLLQRRRQLPP